MIPYNFFRGYDYHRMMLDCCEDLCRSNHFHDTIRLETENGIYIIINFDLSQPILKCTINYNSYLPAFLGKDVFIDCAFDINSYKIINHHIKVVFLHKKFYNSSIDLTYSINRYSDSNNS
jgi:hypothetical protein